MSATEKSESSKLEISINRFAIFTYRYMSYKVILRNKEVKRAESSLTVSKSRTAANHNYWGSRIAATKLFMFDY